MAYPISISYTDSDSSTTDQATYSFAGMSIGAAPAAGESRWIIVAIGVWDDGVATPPSFNLNSVTLGGNTVREWVDTGSGGSETGIFLGVVEMPTGTTATLEFTCDDAQSAAHASLFRVITKSGLNYTQSGNRTSQGASTSAGSLTLNNVGLLNTNGGAYVAIAVADAVEGGTFTWEVDGSGFGTKPFSDTLVEGSTGYVSLIYGTLSDGRPNVDVINSDVSGDFVAGYLFLKAGGVLPLAANGGSYAITGNEASLAIGSSPVLNAEAGAYALTGGAASLELGYVVAGNAGSYAVTGGDASLFLSNIARPNADVTDGTWTNELGSSVNLYASIDEETIDDADYIKSADLESTQTDTCEVALSALGDPGTAVGHRVHYRYRAQGTVATNLTVRLVEGVTVIASNSHTGAGTSFVEGEFTLSEAEANAISDYSDLRLRFTAEAQ